MERVIAPRQVKNKTSEKQVLGYNYYMDSRNMLKIGLKGPVCLKDLSEDSLRTFVNALMISADQGSFDGVVLSSQGVKVKFVFGPDGNFDGVTARVDGRDITLIPGTNGGELKIFEGKPTPTYPGAGWIEDAALTQSLLNQPVDNNQWTAFIARRVPVLNTIQQQ